MGSTRGDHPDSSSSQCLDGGRPDDMCHLSHATLSILIGTEGYHLVRAGQQESEFYATSNAHYVLISEAFCGNTLGRINIDVVLAVPRLEISACAP